MAFLRLVLSRPNGKAMTLGEAQRQAKNLMITSDADRTTNKLQYSLLGDPALSLCLPSLSAVVDSINGVALSPSAPVKLRAGSKVRLSGHIEQASDFDGVVTAVVRDVQQLITCKQNASAETTKAFTFYDRPGTLYSGSDSVRQGRFSLSFAVPRDISYSDESGLINLYAVNTARTLTAHGTEDGFTLSGSDETAMDSVGPKIYCYLNTAQFQNGSAVNPTPYFVARLTDADGINASGSGIGHDMQLIIDGDASKTYTLNDHFQFDFGTYTSGSTYYNIPTLEPGRHTLLFRAWDVLNNPSTAMLEFTVVKGLVPSIYSVDVSANPASTNTTFIVNHDFSGCTMDVSIDVFDMSGRLLWTHSERGVSSPGAYTIDWDLCQDGGSRLPTGVYLYRVRVASDGSVEASKARKLVVISNK